MIRPNIRISDILDWETLASLPQESNPFPAYSDLYDALKFDVRNVLIMGQEFSKKFDACQDYHKAETYVWKLIDGSHVPFYLNRQVIVTKNIPTDRGFIAAMEPEIQTNGLTVYRPIIVHTLGKLPD